MSVNLRQSDKPQVLGFGVNMCVVTGLVTIERDLNFALIFVNITQERAISHSDKLR